MSFLTGKVFRRLFSLNVYKKPGIRLGAMTLSRDFTALKDGDPYPVTDRRGAFSERVFCDTYAFRGEADASVARFFARLFPYATYAMTVRALCGACGFSFRAGGPAVLVLLQNAGGALSLVCRGDGGETVFPLSGGFSSGTGLVVTVRPGKLDVYLRQDDCLSYRTTFDAPSLAGLAKESVFLQAEAAVCAEGEASFCDVAAYLDTGVALADIRPMRYENGEVLLENGKVYLTASVRLQEGSYQGVFSWVPGTAEFRMTGAVFYDAGDGVWGNDVAASFVYDRAEKAWYVWMCSFTHGHILGRARLENDLRFGVGVADIRLFEPLPENALCAGCAAGKEGDEDPDLIYWEEEKKWLLSVCRLVGDGDGQHYRYHFFLSEEPLDGFRFIGRTESGDDTGGTLMRRDGKLYLVCGSCYDKRAEYRVYDLRDLSRYETLHFDYDDGGFRGWGTLIPVRTGNRERLYHLTFDRMRFSDRPWSYGNVYGFVLGE